MKFDKFEIQRREGRLLVDGDAVHLGQRAFAVLVALAERPGRIVSKNELLDIAWPDVVVEENNLQVQVWALRKVIGADAIATVPGRGYRFTPVIDSPADVPGPAQSLAPGAGPDLIGRQHDLASLAALASAERLVTVIGPGGMGKTTLVRALTVVDTTPDKALLWVDLAPHADADAITRAVAGAAGLSLEAGSDVQQALATAVARRPLLLVLDNAEHVVDAVAQLADFLLTRAPQLHIVVTSQTPVGLGLEHCFRLGSLAVPARDVTAAEALRFGAVALFAARARALDRQFALSDAHVPDVVEICQGLEGIPLAIELAAARLPLLGVSALASALDTRLQLLTKGRKGAPPRQRSLLDALNWSHGLLSAAERSVFRRLAVFRGSFSLDSACSVCTDPGLDRWAVLDALGELVDRSLVVVDQGEAPRYRLLETMRLYGLAQLETSGEAHATRLRQAQAMRVVFEAFYEDYWVQPVHRWRPRYEPELEDLRAALDWTCTHHHDTAIALAGATALYFGSLGHGDEAHRRCNDLRPACSNDTPEPEAARFWCMCALENSVSMADAIEVIDRSTALCRRLGDRRGLYISLSMLALKGSVRAPERSRAALAEALQIEDPAWPSRLLFAGNQARAATQAAAGRYAEARSTLGLSLRWLDALGDAIGLQWMRALDVEYAVCAGDIDGALAQGSELVADLAHCHSETRTAWILRNQLHACLAAGQVAQARAVATQVVAVAPSALLRAPWPFFGLAQLAAIEGRFKTAALLTGHADTNDFGDTLNPMDSRARALTRAICAESLDDDAWLAWAREGARLSAQEALNLAL